MNSRCSLVAQTLLLPCLADSCSYIGVCTTLLVDYTAQVGEGLYFFQDLLFQLDGVSVVRIHFQDLCLPPLDVQFKLCTGGRHIICLLLHLLLSVGGSGEPGHLQNRCPRVVSIDSTEFHFAFMLWMSSWSNRSPALSDPSLHLNRVCDLSPVYHLAAGHSLVGDPDDVGQLVQSVSLSRLSNAFSHSTKLMNKGEFTLRTAPG